MTEGRGTPYSKADYRRARAQLVRNPTGCVYCGRPATTLDHVPALVLHAHEPGSGCCELHPCCARCNSRHGQRLGARRRRARNVARQLAESPSRAW